MNPLASLQSILGAATTAFGCDEDTDVDQQFYIAKGRVQGATGELGVFGCGNLPLVTVEKCVQDETLPVVDRNSGVDPLPRGGLLEDARKGFIGADECAVEALEEPD